MRIVERLGKRPMTSDHRVKGQQGLSQCSAYEKVHEGVCYSKGLCCYRVAGLVMSTEGDLISRVLIKISKDGRSRGLIGD